MHGHASVRSLHDVRLANGVNIKYARQGPETGPAVIMLHGYSDSWFSFSRVLPLLPGELRVIVPDQRGHGESDRPASGYTIGNLATDALQLMDALEVPKAAVVGHSMGSFVARRVAEQAPAKVAHLVLIGAALVADNPAIRELAGPVNALVDPVDPEFVREFQASTVVRPVPDDFMAHVVRNSSEMPARVWQAMLDGLIAFRAGPPLRCPTLVLGGTHDVVFPRREQEALAGSIRGARLVLFEGVGHAPHWEDPERVAEEMEQLLESGDRAR